MKLLINLKVIEKETWRLHLPKTVFSTSLVSFFDFLRSKEMFCKKVVLQGTTPPLMLSNSVWSLLLLSGPKNHNNLTFLWICYCLFAGQGLSSSEDNDIAQKQKPKENQKRKKKGKKLFDSGNVLGWTWTVPKGTDVETLHKLLYLCISFNGVLCCTVSLSIPNAICIITKTWYKKIHLIIRTISQYVLTQFLN